MCGFQNMIWPLTSHIETFRVRLVEEILRRVKNSEKKSGERINFGGVWLEGILGRKTNRAHVFSPRPTRCQTSQI